MDLLETCETRGYERVALHRGIQKRLRFLEPADRKLLEMTLGGKVSRREAAMIMGVDAGNCSSGFDRISVRVKERFSCSNCSVQNSGNNDVAWG